MKKNTTYITLAVLLFISPMVAGQQVCKDHVDDDWSDIRYDIVETSGEYTVLDKKIGLMWQQCSWGQSGVGCSVGNSGGYSWQQALEIPVTINESRGFAGYNDWRLPNIAELRTLIAFNCASPAINLTAFPNTGNQRYWSSTPYAYLSIYTWRLNFADGKETVYGTRYSPNKVRLVRNFSQ